MNQPHPLGQLNALQRLMTQLIEPFSDTECRTPYHPAHPPLLWYYGRAAYTETLLLRGEVEGETDLTDRVRHLFEPAGTVTPQQWDQLPPKEHLLNWALELQEENLMRLANPGRLPDHPLLQGQRLVHLINQSRALVYEAMLQVLVGRRLHLEEPFRCSQPLTASQPQPRHLAVSQGHYRVGALDDPAARDNELPPQVIQLSNFRIDPAPVSNSDYLAFIQAGGYREPSLWSSESRDWLQDRDGHPHHWRQDDRGDWYGVSLNGPADLVPDEPVMGLSLHEAQAYANWVAAQGGSLAGAVLQHEYQWEVARRSQILEQYGRVWEWCSNRFEAYSEYRPENLPECGSGQFEAGHQSLRGGGCLHSQPAVRRLSFRHHASPDIPQPFAGTRLVFPPEQ
ncbi:MAG: formylglycine-generating enzyme family protein [Sedimenticola sp.]|nr:formylglycine-generating enzyme family protein [Sedimenticola sp.]